VSPTPGVASADTPRRQRGVCKLPHAQRHIDALLHQIDLSVIEYNLQIEIRMLSQELRQQRNEMDAGERHGRTNAQPALQRTAGTTRGGLGLASLVDGAPARSR
jgi:hypothetical protein